MSACRTHADADELLIAESPGLRTTDIARQAGITTSNAQRPLQQLLEEGRVERDAAKRWASAASS